MLNAELLSMMGVIRHTEIRKGAVQGGLKVYNAVGVCPQCGYFLILIQDSEKRKWVRCINCGAQFPLEQGHSVTGSLPDKVPE